MGERWQRAFGIVPAKANASRSEPSDWDVELIAHQVCPLNDCNVQP